MTRSTFFKTLIGLAGVPFVKPEKVHRSIYKWTPKATGYWFKPGGVVTITGRRDSGKTYAGFRDKLKRELRNLNSPDSKSF